MSVETEWFVFEITMPDGPRFFRMTNEEGTRLIRFFERVGFTDWDMRGGIKTVTAEALIQWFKAQE